jgi:hypothetical protein
MVEVVVEVLTVDMDFATGPVIFWPTWIAMAERAGTVAEKVPALEIVYLLNHQTLLLWNARQIQLTSYQSMRSTRWWRR